MIANLKQMSLNQIASLIFFDWKKVHYSAEPYLNAMGSLKDMDSKYILDDATSIVAYFLSNAGSWKGDVAKEVKKELNSRLKEAYKKPIMRN